jgi:ribonuclease H / adenosylcobalamin/alpha-ribazole phosphatase
VTEPASTRAPRTHGPATTLVLARHGRTVLTEQRRFSGSGGLDPDLSAAGEQDAARLATAVVALGTPGSPIPDLGAPTRILSSPMRRTQQTATGVARRLGLGVEVVADWIEAGFGAWDGLTYGEIAQRWPDQLARWQGSATEAPPGGESLDHIVTRVRGVRAGTVSTAPGEVVLVVTHVTPIRVVVQEALDAGTVALWRIRIAPCSLTVVRYWPDHGE